MNLFGINPYYNTLGLRWVSRGVWMRNTNDRLARCVTIEMGRTLVTCWLRFAFSKSDFLHPHYNGKPPPPWGGKQGVCACAWVVFPFRLFVFGRNVCYFSLSLSIFLLLQYISNYLSLYLYLNLCVGVRVPRRRVDMDYDLFSLCVFAVAAAVQPTGGLRWADDAADATAAPRAATIVVAAAAAAVGCRPRSGDDAPARTQL